MDKEIQTEFDERVDLFQFESGLTRERAEEQALDIINRRYRRGYTVEDFKTNGGKHIE